MIVYGRGCAGCQTIPRTEQDRPQMLPMGAKHGTGIAYEVYGCRCSKCLDYKAREAMSRKEGEGAHRR